MAVTGAEQSGRADRRIVTLLTVLVVLMAILLVGLTGAGLLAVREYRRATASLQRGMDAAGPGQLVSEAGEVMDEMTARQATAAHQLKAISDATDKRISELQTRRDGLVDARGGPMKKLETQIRIMQLMTDEMLAMLRHLSSTQRVMANAMRPLPTQRELAERREGEAKDERAIGGAGDSGESEGDGDGEGDQKPKRNPK